MLRRVRLVVLVTGVGIPRGLQLCSQLRGISRSGGSQERGRGRGRDGGGKKRGRKGANRREEGGSNYRKDKTGNPSAQPSVRSRTNNELCNKSELSLKNSQSPQPWRSALTAPSPGKGLEFAAVPRPSSGVIGEYVVLVGISCRSLSDLMVVVAIAVVARTFYSTATVVGGTSEVG